MTERTLILLKPDAVERGLRGEILRRLEAKGYGILALDQRVPDPDTLAQHYAEHEGKPFHAPLVTYMGSGPLVALVAEGEGVIAGFRSLAGATNPTEAAPGSIRGDLAREWDAPVIQNLVHGSDSTESAEREIGIWFPGLV
ncbi:nucleoside-diphosphate kinase [Brachybacterium endophyticum]|uniref:Nucleoside diphosphate kinase n=1 Tax=Brachybacterium endophyticum TaxID=2182385 RepID=A0A2U2RLF5_9MICO|nr:nucleoside-diphosphate kinase [Brachybacterium endophyticum]PWH06708.1 nucleoside-diphosphate kinase [Brachybacterium endophyticum]